MSRIYLLASYDDGGGPYAFSTLENAIDWFIDNIVKEYVDYQHSGHDELLRLCGPTYLEPNFGNFEVMLQKFSYHLHKIPLDPD